MARHFNGTSDFIQVSFGRDTPVTMACWFFAADIATRYTLMSLVNAGDSQMHRLRADGVVAGDPIIATSNAGDSDSSAISTTGFSANKWHHACGIFASPTSRSVFIDGGSSATNTTNLNPTDPTTLDIGRQGGPTPAQYLNGGLADIALWDVALSAEEVLYLAQGARPNLIRPGNLVFYAPLWGVASPEPDLSVNKNDGTITGTVLSNHPPIGLFTPKWAASAPLIEEAVGGGGPAAGLRTFTLTGVGI